MYDEASCRASVVPEIALDMSSSSISVSEYREYSDTGRETERDRCAVDLVRTRATEGARDVPSDAGSE